MVCRKIALQRRLQMYCLDGRAKKCADVLSKGFVMRWEKLAHCFQIMLWVLDQGFVVVSGFPWPCGMCFGKDQWSLVLFKQVFPRMGAATPSTWFNEDIGYYAEIQNGFGFFLFYNGNNKVAAYSGSVQVSASRPAASGLNVWRVQWKPGFASGEFLFETFLFWAFREDLCVFSLFLKQVPGRVSATLRSASITKSL